MRWLLAIGLGIAHLASASAAAPHQALRSAVFEPLPTDYTLSHAQPNVLADAKHQRWILTWQSRDAKGCSGLHSASLPMAAKPSNKLEAGLIAKGCDWFVNWADFPSLQVAENGDWLSFHLKKSAADSYAYDLWLTRSIDQGKTWQAPFLAHRDGQSVQHGFVSLSPLRGDRFLAVWLDGRKGSSDHSSTGHGNTDHSNAGHSEHDHEDQMTLRSAEVSRAGVISAETEIDARVCSCCSTDLASVGNEQVLVFRDRSSDEIRDIGIARYTKGRWRSSGKTHDDQWRIAGCPVNGAAIAANANDALLVWPTMLENGALSIRARKLSGSPTAFLTIAEGQAVQGRVDVAAWGKDRWLVSWLGTNLNAQPALMVAIIDSKLTIVERTEVALVEASRSIGIPKLASMTINGKPNALLLWTEVVEDQRIAERPRTIVRGSRIGL